MDELRHWIVAEEYHCEYLEIDVPSWTNALCAMRRLSERFRWILGEDPEILAYRAWSDSGEFSLRLEREPDVGTGVARLEALRDRSPEFECFCGYWCYIPADLVADVRGSLTHYMRPRWFNRDGVPVFALQSGNSPGEVIAICPDCARRGLTTRSLIWTPPTDQWIAEWCRRAAQYAPRYRNVEYLDVTGRELLIRGSRILNPTDRAVGCEQLMETGW